jgi:hypothetical protein
MEKIDDPNLFTDLQTIVRDLDPTELIRLVTDQYRELSERLGPWKFWDALDNWLVINSFRREAHENDPEAQEKVVWDVTSSIFSMFIHYGKQKIDISEHIYLV